MSQKKADFLTTWNALTPEEKATMLPDLKGWEAKWAAEALSEGDAKVTAPVAGANSSSKPSSEFALVETTGMFMLLDPYTLKAIEAHRPTVAKKTSFVKNEIDRKRLRVLQEDVHFSDEDYVKDPSIAE